MSYFDQVEKTVKDAWKEFIDEVGRIDDPDNRPDVFRPREKFDDMLRHHIDADVDGMDCEEVMSNTRNPDAIHDGGWDPSATGKQWREILKAFCYHAYRQDVWDAASSYDPEGYVDTVQEKWDEMFEEEDEDDSEPPPPPRPSRRGPTAKEVERFFEDDPLPPGVDPVDIFGTGYGRDDDDESKLRIMRLPSWKKRRR